MSEPTPADYHFCTLGDFLTPKQLPSLDFVTKITNICHVPMTLFESPQRNIYDRKNHILYINNYDSYARALHQKYGRSVPSFQKQLKMMGFKKRKIKQPQIDSYTDIKFDPMAEGNGHTYGEEHEEGHKFDDVQKQLQNDNKRNNRIFTPPNPEIKKQKTHPHKYMFVWRTNRHALIETELQTLELTYSQEVQKATLLKEQMEKRKNALDQKLQTILFHSLLNSPDNVFADLETQVSADNSTKSQQNPKNETVLERSLKEALKELRVLSNESQIQTKNLVKSVSENSGKELELFRILIYKESQIHKAIEEE